MFHPRTLAIAATLLASTTMINLAHADVIPEQIKSMLDQAVATGNADTLKTVADLVKKSAASSAGEIDAYVVAYQKKVEDARVAKLATASLAENWTGAANLGLNFSQGNSKISNIYLGVAMQRDGLQWRHKVHADVDFLKNFGVTTRKHYDASFESNYKVNDRLYVFGLLGWESDKYAGYSRRFTESVGVGYRVINEPNLTFDVEAGPSARQTHSVVGNPAFLTDPTQPLFIPATPYATSNIGGRVNGDLLWKLSNTISFTENLGALFDKASTSTYSKTALNAKLTDHITASAGLDIRHESKTFAAKKTDTAERFTIGYAF